MTSNTITVLVQYKIKKKKLAKATTAITEYVEAVKKDEPGTTNYQVFQDADDRSMFIHMMSFVNKDAKKAHEKSPHLKQLKKILVPISKGKAVYTNMTTMQHTAPAESHDETTQDSSSHEPI